MSDQLQVLAMGAGAVGVLFSVWATLTFAIKMANLTGDFGDKYHPLAYVVSIPVVPTIIGLIWVSIFE